MKWWILMKIVRSNDVQNMKTRVSSLFGTQRFETEESCRCSDTLDSHRSVSIELPTVVGGIPVLGGGPLVHSILSRRKQNKPINLCTPFRRKREEHWIRQLGTAAPYGCNEHIDCIGNLTSPGCQSVNVLNIFYRTSRRHRSHDSRRYNKPEIHNASFDGLLPFVNLQLGLHHIRTRLYSLPLKTLHVLYESTLTLHITDAGSPEHRLQGIIWTFPQTGFSKLSGFVILLKQRIGQKKKESAISENKIRQ